jgi:hypothetical protein
MGYVVARIGRYRIVEGIGPHGGFWFAIGRGERVTFGTRREAEDHAEISSYGFKM